MIVTELPAQLCSRYFGIDRRDLLALHWRAARAETAGIMGAAPSVVEHGVWFTRIMLAVTRPSSSVYDQWRFFRRCGDARDAMRYLAGDALNIVLGRVSYSAWGLPKTRHCRRGGGDAHRTAARGAITHSGRFVIAKGGRFEITPRHFRIETEIMGRLVKLSATGTFQVFIGMASCDRASCGTILNVRARTLWLGYVVGIRVILFALLPSWGVERRATMVGQVWAR